MPSMREAGRSQGERADGPLRRGMQQKGAIRKMLEGVWTAEPCIVDDYRATTQRVDVRLKNAPEQAIIPDVPILGTSGDLVTVRGFRTVRNSGIEGADVGMLLYPRTNGKTSFQRRKPERPIVEAYHEGMGPVFLPGPHIVEDGPFEMGEGLDGFGPDDTALVHSTGSFIMFKHTGDVVIKSAGKVFIGPKDANASGYSDAGVGSLGSTGNVKLG